MEQNKTMEKNQQYQEKIKELFKETVSAEVYESWADTFELEFENEKQIVVIYDGAEDIKKFRQECQSALIGCVDSVMGTGYTVKIVKKNRFHSLSPKTKKNLKALKFFALGMLFVCIATAVIVVLCSYINNRNFRETFYLTSSIKVDSRVRVVHLSDLHGTSYGKNNKKLVERVKALEPDVIICTGDMVDSVTKEEEFILSLAKDLYGIAPCYYVYGNNEIESIYGFSLTEENLDKKFGFDATNRDESAMLQLEDSFEEKLENAGMKVLKNEKDTIRIDQMDIDVYGVLTSNPSSFWSYSGTAFSDFINENPDHLKIMAIHEPFIYEDFAPEFWGDLMVCGHTHGGVIRVPVLGPLFTNEGGLFPARNGDFVYGRYDAAGKPLIVSSGLENSNVLRINNQPELVVIDINKF